MAAIVFIDVISERTVGKRSSSEQVMPSQAHSGAETTSMGALAWMRQTSW